MPPRARPQVALGLRILAALAAVAAAAVIGALVWRARSWTDGAANRIVLPFLSKFADGGVDPAAATAAPADGTPTAPAGAATPITATATAAVTATVAATSTAALTPTVAATAAASRWTYLTYRDGVSRLAVDEARGVVWAVGWGGAVAWDARDGIWRGYDRDDGLPSLRLSSVAVGAGGTVWVGTRGDGAARLGGDGRWHALSFGDGPWDDDVLAIAADPDGSTWFGTSAGASRLRPDGTLVHYRRDRGEVAGTVTSIAIDGAGNRWFGTYYSGLSVLRPDGRWETFKAQAAGGGLSFDLVLDLQVDRAGRVWVISAGPSPDGQPGFLDAVDIVAPDGTWSAVDPPDRPADTLLRGLAFDDQNRPWFAADDGLYAPQGNGRWQRITAADGLPADAAAQLVFDRAGDLWAATGAGLGRRAPDGTWRAYRAGGLPSPIVNAVTVDTAGAGWLATGGGLVRRDPDGTLRTWTARDGLARDAVYDVAADPTGGVWFANGWSSEDAEDGAVVHLAPDGRLSAFTMADGLPSSAVTDIAVESAGHAWFATRGYFYAPGQRRDGGLARRDADGTWSAFDRDDGLPRGGDVGALAVAPDGGLWVGSDVITGAPKENLSHRAPDGTWTRVPLPARPESDDVYALAIDHAGHLWVGTWGGVFRRAPDGSWTTPDDDPALAFQASAIAVAPDGALWFSAAPGTVRVHHPDGLWQTITEADGLAPPTIEDIAIGPDGTAWFVGREGGVAILAPEAGGGR